MGGNTYSKDRNDEDTSKLANQDEVKSVISKNEATRGDQHKDKHSDKDKHADKEQPSEKKDKEKNKSAKHSSKKSKDVEVAKKPKNEDNGGGVHDKDSKDVKAKEKDDKFKEKEDKAKKSAQNAEVAKKGKNETGADHSKDKEMGEKAKDQEKDIFAQIGKGEAPPTVIVANPPPNATIAADNNMNHGHIIQKGKYRYSPAFEAIRNRVATEKNKVKSANSVNTKTKDEKNKASKVKSVDAVVNTKTKVANEKDKATKVKSADVVVNTKTKSADADNAKDKNKTHPKSGDVVTKPEEKKKTKKKSAESVASGKKPETSSNSKSHSAKHQTSHSVKSNDGSKTVVSTANNKDKMKSVLNAKSVHYTGGGFVRSLEPKCNVTSKKPKSVQMKEQAAGKSVHCNQSTGKTTQPTAAASSPAPKQTGKSSDGGKSKIQIPGEANLKTSEPKSKDNAKDSKSH